MEERELILGLEVVNLEVGTEPLEDQFGPEEVPGLPAHLVQDKPVVIDRLQIESRQRDTDGDVREV